ncbi:hypothetical protein AK88_05207 [Plasmodium fragile]|uniref:Schizont-infected cell agglutination extracellular alpha domain-containing protein n=1 Tax=Plasmodium fragile TaxID=5857 RepID=A0A0D9QDX6_PLAFR|nr:uncharacterized protein AK88_05207 [Plasmodium fragile]KJP85164.1 hypothetical protein AK88_05207 [Plasmodium fragile]
MEQEDEHGLLGTLCEQLHDQGGTREGAELDTKNKAICELALRELHFKHRIPLTVAAADSRKTGNMQDTVESYMRCILVNIFMKRIMGQKCVKTAGGKTAFKAAEALVKDAANRQPNMACERDDMKDKSARRGEPGEWDSWTIMERWFDRNTTKLNDGNEGVLGKDCKVQLNHTRNSQKQEVMTALKEKVQHEMNVVEEQIKTRIQELKTDMDNSARGQGIGNILTQKAQQENDKETRPRQEQSTPPAERPATPAPAKPNSGGAAAKPVAATPGPGTNTAQPGVGEDCPWMSVMDRGHRALHVIVRYSSEQLQALKTVLQEFADYMDKNKEHMDTWGTNCENYGWDDFGQ